MSTRLLRSVVAAAALLLALSVHAFAYEGEVSVQVDVTGPSRAVCPAALTATVTVVDKDGHPMPGVEVTWSTGDVGTTDANGQHSITLNVATDVDVSATAMDATGHLLIDCGSGEVLSAVGLPRTDTAAPEDGDGIGSALVGGLLVVTGLLGVQILRRREVAERA